MKHAEETGGSKVMAFRRRQHVQFSILAGLITVGAVYWFPVRRWFSRWGTTLDERVREMPGDELIAHPTRTDNQAVTVNAPPGDIWPWLVQMGYHRGGLYSYDWLDRLFGFLDRSSATRILPEFQQLAVGDKIYFGPVELTVSVLEPNRQLALYSHSRDWDWVWNFGLYPVDEERTRLVDRGTERVANTPMMWLVMRFMEPAAFIMTRRMLLGLKARAEALHAGTADQIAPARRIEASVLIASPVEQVWRFITDPANAPQWDPAAVEMTQTSTGPAGPGTTLHLELSEYPKVEDFRVVEYEVNRRFVLEYTSGPVKGTTMAFDLEQASGKTKLNLTWSLQFAGFGRLIGPLITRNARNEAATFVANIRRLVEAAPVVA